MLYNTTIKKIVQSKVKKLELNDVVKFFKDRGKKIPTVKVSSDGYIDINEEDYNELSDTEKTELKNYLDRF